MVQKCLSSKQIAKVNESANFFGPTALVVVEVLFFSKIISLNSQDKVKSVYEP